MQENQLFVGVDVSKSTLDICLLTAQEARHVHIKNEAQAINAFCQRLLKQSNSVIISLENTGRYGMLLLDILASFNFTVYVINPLHLSKSQGLSRLKTDKADAHKIARFTMRNYHDLQPWKPRLKAVDELAVLLAERRSLVKNLKQIKTKLKELQTCKTLACYQHLEAINKEAQAFISKQIKGVEQQIRLLIKTKEEMQHHLELLKTVRGIGEVLAWHILLKTNNFTTVVDPRKFACHAGVVPFDKSSGTSIKQRPKVSVYADKEIKKLLHLAAISIIRIEGELKEYYIRKVAEGKSKMKVINALRNKIIHRAFAVIRDNRPYQNILPDNLTLS